MRLIYLDTEEIWPSGSKPVITASKLASQWAKDYFGVDDEGFPNDDVFVDVEFDTNDPVNRCLKKHRGNYGRPICYVYKRSDNYNLKAVKEG